ncbi:MAG: trypsin-like peptidase domain-containing protein [Candidatus Aminicenantes bacterium]
MKKFSLFFVLFVSISLMFAFAGDEFVKKVRTPEYRQAFMERSPGTFDAAEYNRIMEVNFNWLRSEAASLGSIITVNVTEEDLAELNRYECETCGQRQKLRVGLVKPVGFQLSFPSMDSLTRTADGGFVWTGVVESPGATALRLHFINFDLPDNTALYVYGLNGEAFGPYMGLGYTNSGEFWSHTITGPVAYVQVRNFGPVSENELRSISFNIESAGYLSEKFLIPFYMPRTPEFEGVSGVMEHCPDNEWCVEDASCYSGTAINEAKNAAGYMEWVSGAWIYMCSGGLIADTDTSTQIPYFLTANHCISKARDAANLECYFQYATSACHASCPDPGTFPRTIGATIMDSSRDGDHTLLQLNENPPSGSVFLGWTNQPVATADGTQLFRISYPSGMPQAYSKHEVDSDYIECSGLPVGEFIYSYDLEGATEGGSSGSPVMNMSGQIVGQLYGGCGYTLEVCDAENNRTVDGAFAFYYDQVAPFLDNGGPGPGGDEMHVDSIVVSLKAAGPNNTCKAVVTILDENSNPVEGATVTGTFSGDASGTESGVTGADGEVTLSVLVVGKGAVQTFTFCVDNVTHASFEYDDTANVETCDTY